MNRKRFLATLFTALVAPAVARLAGALVPIISENGNYSSIKGLGWTEFRSEKALNIAKCMMLDSARMAGVVVSAKSAASGITL